MKKLTYWAAPGIADSTSHINLMTKVSEAFSVPVSEMFSKSQERDIVEARGAFFYILSEYYKISLSRIGKKYGKHHATIINSKKRVIEWNKYDKVFSDKFNKVLKDYEAKH